MVKYENMWIALVVFGASLGAYVVSEVEIPIKYPPGRNGNAWAGLLQNHEDEFYEMDIESEKEETEPYFDVKTDVFFELYTRSNPVEPYLLNIFDVDSLIDSPFNSSHPTRINVHGWRSDGEMKEALLDAYFNKTLNEYNYIHINWTEGSYNMNYYLSRGRVNEMGFYVAAFVDILVEVVNLDLEDLVMVGHSLGAHIIGIAGKNIKSGTVPMIVGLDPALRLFSIEDSHERLAIGDARYVEIIHSNAGVLGFLTPLGDASFYPNGGRIQPGCGWNWVQHKCAHSRSYAYYAESIFTSRGFYAWKCESFEDVLEGKCLNVDPDEIVSMGGESVKNASGIYYLNTGDEPLFALGIP